MNTATDSDSESPPTPSASFDVRVFTIPGSHAGFAVLFRVRTGTGSDRAELSKSKDRVSGGRAPISWWDAQATITSMGAPSMTPSPGWR
jgi:hypothetical protein